MKEKATHDDQQFSTGRSLRPVLNIGAFSTDELVPGGKPILTGGFHPVLALNFLAVQPCTCMLPLCVPSMSPVFKIGRPAMPLHNICNAPSSYILLVEF